MVSFTKQEKAALIILALVILAGSGLHLALKQFPFLKNFVNFVESNQIYPKVDVNKATYEELINIPYIGPSTAKAILEYRQQKGTFTSLEQLKSIKGIKAKNYQKFIFYLRISQKQ